MKRNVYLNLETKGPQKSAWCIFQAGSDLKSRLLDPIACSSRTYTFEEVDEHIVNSLRSWVKAYIKEKGSLVYPKNVKLIDRNKELAEEKDLIVHVVQKVKTSSDTISLFVQDESDACELVVYNIFNYIEAGHVVRVRSFRTYQK